MDVYKIAEILKPQRFVKFFSGHFLSLPLEKQKKIETTFQFDLRLRCHKLALEKSLHLGGGGVSAANIKILEGTKNKNGKSV